MIAHDLLVMAIQARWPQLEHGRDYMVGHNIDAAGAQASDAYIMQWRVATIPEPDLAPLLDEAAQLESEYLAREARSRRNGLLYGSDWTQLPDVGAAMKSSASAWATYREALRDLTEQPGFPADIDWPTPPA